MYRQLLLIVYLVLQFIQPLSAVQVEGLYEVVVPVDSQSEAERKAALQTAFRLVLIKLTGDRQAPGNISVGTLMARAQDYMQQYSYREVSEFHKNDQGELLESTQTQLWVKFDESNLNRALRDLSVPVWGRERPSTLVWLALGDENGRQLVGPDDVPEMVEAIRLQAEQRGIVLLFPLLDLDDTAILRVSDIWGGFRGPVIEASRRYHADSILTGVIESPVEGIWEVRWTAFIDDKMASWTGESDLATAALEEGVDNLADILASEFARIPVIAGMEEILLSVADIENVDQYADVLKYLSGLNSVADVEVIELQEQLVTFRLSAHGGELAVTKAIELGRLLSPISGSANVNYRLLP